MELDGRYLKKILTEYPEIPSYIFIFFFFFVQKLHFLVICIYSIIGRDKMNF